MLFGMFKEKEVIDNNGTEQNSINTPDPVEDYGNYLDDPNKENVDLTPLSSFKSSYTEEVNANEPVPPQTAPMQSQFANQMTSQPFNNMNQSYQTPVFPPPIQQSNMNMPYYPQNNINGGQINNKIPYQTIPQNNFNTPQQRMPGIQNNIRPFPQTNGMQPMYNQPMNNIQSQMQMPQRPIPQNNVIPNPNFNYMNVPNQQPMMNINQQVQMPQNNADLKKKLKINTSNYSNTNDNIPNEIKLNSIGQQQTIQNDQPLETNQEENINISNISNINDENKLIDQNLINDIVAIPEPDSEIQTSKEEISNKEDIENNENKDTNETLETNQEVQSINNTDIENINEDVVKNDKEIVKDQNKDDEIIDIIDDENNASSDENVESTEPQNEISNTEEDDSKISNKSNKNIKENSKEDNESNTEDVNINLEETKDMNLNQDLLNSIVATPEDSDTQLEINHEVSIDQPIVKTLNTPQENIIPSSQPFFRVDTPVQQVTPQPVFIPNINQPQIMTSSAQMNIPNVQVSPVVQQSFIPDINEQISNNEQNIETGEISPELSFNNYSNPKISLQQPRPTPEPTVQFSIPTTQDVAEGYKACPKCGQVMRDDYKQCFVCGTYF